jgi:hypothetical protein
VEIDVPRDTGSTFDPQIVKKRQRRLTGVDEIVLSLSAKGLTTGTPGARRTYPDHEKRAAFVRKFTLTSAKAMHDLRRESLPLSESQIADELARRIRIDFGPDFPLPRPQLLQLVRDVFEGRG